MSPKLHTQRGHWLPLGRLQCLPFTMISNRAVPQRFHFLQRPTSETLQDSANFHDFLPSSQCSFFLVLAFFQHIQPLNDERNRCSRAWRGHKFHATHSVKEPKGDQKEANVLYMFKMFQDYRGKKCQVLSADSFGTTNNLEFVLLQCFRIFLNYVWTLRETLKMSRVMMLPKPQVQRNQMLVQN